MVTLHLNKTGLDMEMLAGKARKATCPVLLIASESVLS